MNPITSPVVITLVAGITLIAFAVTMMARARRVQGWHQNVLTAGVVAAACAILMGPVYATAVVPAEELAAETIELVEVGGAYLGAGVDNADSQVTYYIEEPDGSVTPMSADASSIRIVESEGSAAVLEVAKTVKPASWLWPFDLPADDKYTFVVPTSAS